MDKVDVVWSGGAMGTGYSVLYFTEDTAATHLAALKAFFDAFAGNCPSGVTIRVPGNGDQVDNSNHVTGAWSGTAPAISAGSAPTQFAAGVGMRVRWHTGVTQNSRLVTGSTFLIPLSTGAYQADGSILDTVVNAIQTAANTFVTSCAGDLRVFSKPKTAGGAGGNYAVTSAQVVDRTSWLKTRRT